MDAQKGEMWHITSSYGDTLMQSIEFPASSLMFSIHHLSFSYCSTILKRHSPAAEGSLVMISGAKGYIDLSWMLIYHCAR